MKTTGQGRHLWLHLEEGHSSTSDFSQAVWLLENGLTPFPFLQRVSCLASSSIILYQLVFLLLIDACLLIIGPVQGSIVHLGERPGFYLLLMRKARLSRPQNGPAKADGHWIQKLLRSVLLKKHCLNLLYPSPRKFTADRAPQRTWPGPLTNWRWIQRAWWDDWESVMGKGEPGAPQTLMVKHVTARPVLLPLPLPWRTALPDLPPRQRSMQPALSAGEELGINDVGQHPNLQALSTPNEDWDSLLQSLSHQFSTCGPRPLRGSNDPFAVVANQTACI